MKKRLITLLIILFSQTATIFPANWRWPWQKTSPFEQKQQQIIAKKETESNVQKIIDDIKTKYMQLAAQAKAINLKDYAESIEKAHMLFENRWKKYIELNDNEQKRLIQEAQTEGAVKQISPVQVEQIKKRLTEEALKKAKLFKKEAEKFIALKQKEFNKLNPATQKKNLAKILSEKFTPFKEKTEAEKLKEEIEEAEAEGKGAAKEAKQAEEEAKAEEVKPTEEIKPAEEAPKTLSVPADEREALQKRLLVLYHKLKYNIKNKIDDITNNEKKRELTVKRLNLFNTRYSYIQQIKNGIITFNPDDFETKIKELETEISGPAEPAPKE